MTVHHLLVATSCVEGSVRIVNGIAGSENELPSYGLIKQEVARGRVEICVNGRYGTVLSDNSWDFADASVVCRQMGFSANGLESFHTIIMHILAQLIPSLYKLLHKCSCISLLLHTEC